VTDLEKAKREHDLALHSLHDLYKAQRLAELRGARFKAFDGRGVHAPSEEVGRLLALRELFPDLRDVEFSVLDARFKAEWDAHREFADELALNGVEETFQKEMR
jgi:hypothetical protein